MDFHTGPLTDLTTMTHEGERPVAAQAQVELGCVVLAILVIRAS